MPTTNSADQRKQVGELIGHAIPAFMLVCHIAQLAIDPERMTGEQFAQSVRDLAGRMTAATRISSALGGLPRGQATAFLKVAGKSALEAMLQFADDVLLAAGVWRKSAIDGYLAGMAEPPDPVAWRDATAAEIRENVLPAGMTAWPAVEAKRLWMAAQNEVEEFEAMVAVDAKAQGAIVAAIAGRDVPDNAMMCVSEIARTFGVEGEPLRKRLDRWRRHTDKGWSENPDAASRDAKLLYRVGSVRHLIHQNRPANVRRE